MNLTNTVSGQKSIKQTAYQTERFPLSDPIDGNKLCEKIAESLDAVLTAILDSAKSNGIVVTSTKIQFETDSNDGHQSGCFRVLATGVEQEGEE